MQCIKLHDRDNVAVALQPISAGSSVELDGQLVCVREEIPAGHKFACSAVVKGTAVVKFGASIGLSSEAINMGEHVHVHNLKTALGDFNEYHYYPENLPALDTRNDSLNFQGYRRETGKVGTRNEVWVLSTVGCVSRLAEKIARDANERYQDQCDGIFAFTHPFGCSQLGDDLHNTRNILLALAQHPNAGAVLILGLGCENNQIQSIINQIPESRRARVAYFNCQDVEDELQEGLAKVEQLVSLMSADKRTVCALSDLVVGMKCGGSDGLSGLSANPLLGRISDAVCNTSGTVLLTETPEMFGAEQILMNRAISQPVFEDIVKLINEFKSYFINHGQTIYENPSPGNKKGGITTLEEKSMGAIQKGGTATVTAVLEYAEPFVEKGLNLIQAPGNDAVSSTALTASGATLILFTTGRGTPMGYPAPTIKVASNSKLAKAKPHWIDFDAGRVFEQQSMDAMAEQFLRYIVDVASGTVKTKSEINEQREIAVWKNGVTL
jgi:altronate hydrolase